MHAILWIANRHRRESVAMVGVAKAHEAGSTGDALVGPVLKRHLHGDLHGHRAGFGIKDVVQCSWKEARQPFSELQNGSMHQTAQHDMGHGFKLLRHCVTDVRVVVSMTGRPPRGRAIDQATPVSQENPHTLRSCSDLRFRGSLHLAVRQPELRWIHPMDPRVCTMSHQY